MTETIRIADLDFEVRRSQRRKTIGLRVDRAAELIVHAPDPIGEEELRQWISRKLLWVHRKLAEKQEMNSIARTPEFVSGESFYYLGKSLRLRVVDQGRVPRNVGDLGFRWGSCGKNGVIYFNWSVLQLPVRLIDYVIVHELAHLLEHNHTDEFWRVLDRVLPDWRERKSAMESEWQSFAVLRSPQKAITLKTES